MKVLENYFIFFFFFILRHQKSWINKKKKCWNRISFFFFSSCDIRFWVKKSVNWKMKKKLPNWTIGEAIIAEYFGCKITKSIGPIDYYQEEQFWKFRLGFAVVMANYRNDVGLWDFALLCDLIKIFSLTDFLFIIDDTKFKGEFAITFLWSRLLCWFLMATRFSY